LKQKTKREPGNSRGPLPGKGGAPIKITSNAQIDQLHRMAQTGATRWEMAQMLGVDSDTLAARIKDQPAVREAIETGIAKLRLSLRRKQVAVALQDGHAAQGTMLVWCAKTILGQTDRVTLKIESDEEAVSALRGLFPDLSEEDLETLRGA
jgi:hypothetical protein